MASLDGTYGIADAVTLFSEQSSSIVNLWTVFVVATFSAAGFGATEKLTNYQKSGVTIDSISQDTGLPGDFITRDNTLEYYGSAGANATVGLTLTNASNGQVFTNNVTATASGTWAYTNASVLPDGTYTLYATNYSGSGTTQVIVIDTAAPFGPVTVTPLITTNTTPTITGSAVVGGGETLSVTVNGVTYTAGDGHLTLTSTSLAECRPPSCCWTVWLMWR